MDVVFQDGDTFIPLVLAATPEERHRVSAVATEHEVARGVNFTDHVRPERRVFSARVIITNTPLDNLGGEPTRVADTWAQLVDARDRALPAIITTRLEQLDDMVLIEATVTRTAKDGSWIRAELTFAEIRQVSTELVDDPVPARARDREQTDLGEQALEPAEETPQLRSVLDRLFDDDAGLGSLFGGS
jgi:hypothetical protein